MAAHEHRYVASIEWTGDAGRGTRSYATYGRSYAVHIPGKPILQGSADPAFRGDATLHNPEDLLLAAISGCHMLTYLALCALHGVDVRAYSDAAEGTMQSEADGGGRFTGILLHPRVEIADATHLDQALALHAQAHAKCFIASSVNFPVRHVAEVVVHRAALQ